MEAKLDAIRQRMQPAIDRGEYEEAEREGFPMPRSNRSVFLRWSTRNPQLLDLGLFQADQFPDHAGTRYAATLETPTSVCAGACTPALCGLNPNHNHDLKHVFKSAATPVNHSGDSLGELYQHLVASGMKPAMARLTLARKIAAIVLKIWKNGGRFDPEQLKRQAA